MRQRERERKPDHSPLVFSSQIGAAIVPNVPLLPTMKTGIRAHCRGLRLLHSVNTRHYVSSNLEPAILHVSAIPSHTMELWKSSHTAN